MAQADSVSYSTHAQQAQIETPLNPRKRNHWQHIFRKYDLDNDGKISLLELRAMIESESYEHDIPEHTVRIIMQKVDEDRNGFLDMAEFEKLHWMRIFAKYDFNRDGRISLTELQKLLKQYGDKELPSDVVKSLLQLADRDRDGFLTFEEFDKLCFTFVILAYMPVCEEAVVHPFKDEQKWLMNLHKKWAVHTKEFHRLMGHMLNIYVKSAVVSRKSLYEEPDGTGDYEEEYSCSPPACCMIIISLMEVITYLWDVVSVGDHEAKGPAAQIFIYNPHKRYEAWRFLTYMFVHVGIMHLIVNLLVQILLGVPLEMVHKWWRVLIIYFAGVVAGSLGTSVSDPAVRLAGASGGVYALITAHVSSIIMNWSEMRFAPLQLVVFFILTASDIGTAIYNRYVLNVDSKIGYAAHLAGALAGLLVGINVLRNLQQKKWEKVVWWVSAVLYIALMIAAIIWNVAFPDYFPPLYGL